MSRFQPLFWIRWGATIVAVAIGFESFFGDQVHFPQMPAWIRLCLYFLYAGLFLWNTSVYPRVRHWQAKVLGMQMLVALLLDTSLSVITAATIPVVLKRDKWRGWLIAQLVVIICQVVADTLLRLEMYRAQLPPDMTVFKIWTTIGLSTLELVAWQAFAFIAGMLIVSADEERRRLARLNAELRGAQILLQESGRIAERLRISRELHDSLGHHLTSLNLQLQIAERLPDDQIRSKLGESRFLAKLLLAEIREAISTWRAETTPALPDALRSLFSDPMGLAIELDLQNELPATNPAVGHALFRCAQEAFTNTLRHSGSAKKFMVSLHRQESSLEMDIRDDGDGCSRVAAGNGLSGMVSRIKEFGGDVRFDSVPGKGFHLHVSVPIYEELAT